MYKGMGWGEREGAAHGIITADQTSDENKEKVWGKGQKGDPDLQVCGVGEVGRTGVLSKCTRVSLTPTFVKGRHSDS